MKRDWATLPWPALNLTSKFLTFSIDYVHFRSVCTSWRSSAPKLHHLPLLAGHRLDDDGHFTVFDFSIFTGSQVLPIGIDHPLLPEMKLGRLCCGSSHGWMAFLDPSPGINLFNPVTKSLIPLPYLTDFPDINDGRYSHRKVSKVGDDYVICSGVDYKKEKVKTFWEATSYLANKLILSSDPSTDRNCVALLLRCRWRRMAVCRIGDDAWTPVKFPEFTCFNTDAVFYRGRFHVVCRKALYVLNLDPEPKLERIPMANPPLDGESRLMEINECYLVESGADLLVVYAYYCVPYVPPYGPARDYQFEVYKVDWGMHRVKMFKLRSLGDAALFLGRNQSISLHASKFPGVRSNCIYLAEYYKRNKPGIRVYHMEDGRNEFITNSYSLADPSLQEMLCWRPCTWVMPSLLE